MTRFPPTLETAKVFLIQWIRVGFDEYLYNKVAVFVTTPDRLDEARGSETEDGVHEVDVDDKCLN